MLSLYYTSPCPVQGVLRFPCDPRMSGLGNYRDIDGRLWDVHGIWGRYVIARLVVDNDPRHSTASWVNFSGETRWLPYDVEVWEVVSERARSFAPLEVTV